MSGSESSLSHLDDEGRVRMVDVGGKAVTRRVAVAVGRFETTAEVIGLIRAEGMPKADVLATARLAGIPAPRRGPGTLGADLESVAGRRQFLRGRRRDDGTVVTVAGPGSHLVAALAAAEVLIVVPEETVRLRAGETVEVWDL